MARLTGVDDGEDETVINLTFKQDMNQGWFGTAEAGYGTDDRYTGSFNLNRFWNGNQVTLLGNFNNTNQIGFTDSNGSRFRRFGGNNGITESRALGLNFNVGKEEIIRVGGDIMWSNTDAKTITRQERQYLSKTTPHIRKSTNPSATAATTSAVTSVCFGNQTHSTPSNSAPTSRSTSTNLKTTS